MCRGSGSMNRMQTGRGATLVRTLALAVAAVVVLGGTGVVLWSRSSAGAASSGYQEKRQALATQLAAASQQGYTASDLAPVTSQVGRLDSSSEPWWLPGRAGYFQAQAAQAGALQGQLTAMEQGLKDQARADAGRQTDAIKAAIAQAQQANADDLDVQSLQQRLDAVSRAQGAAHTLKDYRAAASQAQSVAQDAATLLASTQQENQQLAQAAQQLATQSGGELGAPTRAGHP